MDKNRLVLVVALTVMFVTLAALVAMGKDSHILDGMTAIAGALMGTGAYQLLRSKQTPPDD